MAEAVTSFISGAVPAVALWVPFNVTVQRKVPGAKKLVDASAYYPQAAIVGGWAARNDYYDKNRDMLQRVICGWAEGNEILVGEVGPGARDRCRRSTTSRCRSPEFKEQFGARRCSRPAEWRKLYADGTVTEVAAAGDRLLRALWRNPEPGAGVAVLRSEVVPAKR